MWSWMCFGLLFFLTLSYASSDTLIIHERQETALRLDNVVNRQRMEGDVILPMRVSLKQNANALLNAEAWLMDVSDPHSSKYGQYWKQEDVISAFAPSLQSVEIVTEWLRSHGVHEVTHSENKQWLAFDISVKDAERILNTEYYEHQKMNEHGRTIGFEASCTGYRLPSALSQHIDYVKPGIRPFDVTGKTRRSLEFSKSLLKTRSVGDKAEYGSSKKFTRSPSTLQHFPSTGLTNCSNLVTPACIAALYDIPVADSTQKVSSNNTLGLFEYFQSYNQSILNAFYKDYAPHVPSGVGPIVRRIGNASKSIPEEESDLEIVIPIIYPQKVDVFAVNYHANPSPGAFLGNLDRFLDAIDGSYCKKSRQYTVGKQECGIFKPPNVLSISQGSGEYTFNAAHASRICTEFLKLGLQGTSIFVASGDTGVGITNQSAADTACKDPNGPELRLFEPQYPPSCPWITSVGGTGLKEGESVDAREVAGTSVNPQVPFLLSSGGGFSNYFHRPAYQNAAVSDYFQNHDPPWKYYLDGNYNNSNGRYNRNGRGYPDVSAAAKNLLISFEIKGEVITGPNFGTSGSAPIWASIMNRIVEERIRAGKGPVGFVNPVLYKNSNTVTDILSGGNGYCKEDGGFECAPGWDPVTGLGTPNYQRLLDLFISLP